MHLRLHQLRALVGVVEYGGIRAAARSLNISQAALTKSLRDLEDDSEVALLARSSRGVTLTPAGEKLLTRANLIVRQLDLAVDELAQTAKAQRGHINVACTPLVSIKYLSTVLPMFRSRYPNVQVNLFEGLIARVLPRLRDGSVDLAYVANTGDLNTGEFTAHEIRKYQQVVVVRQGHPILQNPTAKGLAELEWIVTDRAAANSNGQLANMLHKFGIETPLRTVVCDSLSIRYLLLSSDAATFAAEELTLHPSFEGAERVHVPDLDPGLLTLTQLHRPDVPLLASMAYFSECMVQACLDDAT
jgi:DNA-binding transcriptional LysR family regulator